MAATALFDRLTDVGLTVAVEDGRYEPEACVSTSPSTPVGSGSQGPCNGYRPRLGSAKYRSTR